MCGIVGFALRSPDSGLMSKMLKTIESRGPDGFGESFHNTDGFKIGLGHRRLSIIDLELGKQPLCNVERTLEITYNGEIFNFKELRSQLEQSGLKFGTHSDTEVILQAYAREGIQSFSRLNGMFAFAIWNEIEQSLTLVRDPVGIKPLYYAVNERGELGFSSRLDSLLLLPFVSKMPDPRAISGYFFSDYIHPPNTILKDVKKLQPGHFVTWRKGVLSEPTLYQNLTNVRSAPDRSERRVSLELDQLLNASVKRQLISDVPVGIFLSGGLDSSLVAALATKLSSNQLKTFSIGFTDPAFDESHFAKRVARHIGSDHHEETISNQKLLDLLPEVLAALDEPLSDPSLLPTYYLSKIASSEVKVVLGGDGGDELWSGYPTYLAQRLAQSYAHSPEIVKSLLSRFVNVLPVTSGYQGLEWKLKRFLNRWDDSDSKRHFRWMSNTDLPEIHRLLGDQFVLPLVITESSKNRITDFNDYLKLDFSTYMPGSVLTKVDRASMAHGLEVRPPLLDHDLIRFSFAQDFGLKQKGNVSKYLLKKVAENYLPTDIIYRKKKGFAIPLATWIRKDLKSEVERVVHDSRLFKDWGLNPQVCQQWLTEHVQFKKDHSRSLWALTVLNHWYERQLSSESAL